MANILDTSFPPLFINGYLQDEFKKFGIVPDNQVDQIFFPVTPSNLDELYNNLLEGSQYPDPLMIVYDRMLRVNPGPFYMRKREQVVYTLHSTSLERIMAGYRIISEALDRMDASAEDVNAWISKNPVADTALSQGQPRVNPLDSSTAVQNVYFHSFKVYQINETRDLLDLASARTIFRNKIIVEYEYHVANPYYN